MVYKIKDKKGNVVVRNGKEVLGTDLQDVEVKAVGENEIEIVGSTDTRDRMDEVISMDGWDLKNWKKNPVILAGHDYTAPAIGRGKVKKSDGKLMFKVEFPEEGVYPLADIYRKLYKGGFMKASSVGFLPTEWSNGNGEKEPYRTYTKQELLELSLVAVPANPDAVMNSFKSAEVDFTALKNIEGIGVKNEKAYQKFIEKVKETENSQEEGDDKDRQDSRDDEDDTGKDDNPDGQPKGSDENGEVTCECVKCGFSQESGKHCKDLSCPECGSEMRRIERPGSGTYESDKGKESVEPLIKMHCEALFKELTETIDEKIDEKIKEALELQKDKDYYYHILFGSVDNKNPKADQKKRTEEIVDAIKEVLSKEK